MKTQSFELPEPRFLRPLERALIGFAVGLIVLSLYLLVSSVSLRSLVLGWPDERPGVPVGEIAQQNGEVRRKGGDGLEFVKTSDSDTVYNADTIITGPNSGTVLKLKDGSEITLGPSTMVRLFFEDQWGLTGIKRLPGVEVLSGEIASPKPTPSLKVLAEGAPIPKAERLRVAVAPPTMEKVFQRALPELDGFRRNTAPVSVVDGSRSKSVPKVQILSPQPNALYRALGQNFSVRQTIPVQWTQNPKELPAKVELLYLGLSDPPTAEPQVVLTKTVESGVESRKINFIVDRPGFYEWRIGLPETEISAAKTVSQNFQISRFVEMIDLRLPEMEAESNVYSGKHMDDFNIAFRWMPLPNIESYTLKVFADSELKKLLYEKEITGARGEARNDNLIKGSQFFIVQAKLPNGYIATSRVGRIGFDFAPPVLALPRDASLFQKAQLQNQKNQILFTWKKTNFTQRYSFQISDSPGFSRILYEVRPEGNFTVLRRDLPKGTYYWRVSSLGRGATSDPSRPHRFEIR